MLRYLTGRVLQTVLSMLVVISIVFFLTRLSGNPVHLLLDVNATERDQEILMRHLGLDKPLAVQYGIYVKNMFVVDFGNSVLTRRPVTEHIWERLPATVELGFVAMFLSVLIGVPLGMYSAVHRGSVLDSAARVFAVLGQSMPAFWLGLMLILIFAVVLGLFPAGGRGGVENIVLPAFTLGYFTSAAILRLARSAMLEVLGSDYIKFARLKGLHEQIVLWKHGLKNALLPVVTFAVMLFVQFLDGARRGPAPAGDRSLRARRAESGHLRQPDLARGLAARHRPLGHVRDGAGADLRLPRRLHRFAADALHRHRPVAADDLDRGRAGRGVRAELPQRRPGHLAPALAALRPADSRRDARDQGAGLRRARRGRRALEHLDHFPPHLSQRGADPPGDLDAAGRLRDSAGGHPELPRRGRAAAESGLGTDDRRRARLPGHGVVDHALPRRGDAVARPGRQPHARLAPRSSGSQAAPGRERPRARSGRDRAAPGGSRPRP